MDRKYRDMRDIRICPDDETAARYFLNRPMSSKDAWIADDIVKRQAATGETLIPGTPIALGFDGSLNDDSTVLIASRMSDGKIFPIEIWAKPDGPAGNWWEVPRSDVLAKVRQTFSEFDVTRMYADPHEWRSDIDKLAEDLGEERVLSWATTRDVAMGAALDRIRTDLMNGSLFHSGDKVMMEHFSNAYVRNKGIHRLVRKEHPKSERKIDSVIGAALAYEARADAISAGWSAAPPAPRRIVVS
jgi:phage terminase large subunit-like protein